MMRSTEESWAEQFPGLFLEHEVAYAGVRARLTLDPVADELVNRLHLVALTDADRVVVCRSAQGWRFLPGGTREPGETLGELTRRELLEEAGAVLLTGPEIFASFRVHSWRAKPYRPHLTHPDAAWSFGICRVELAGPPTNPDDGEDVVEVLALSPEEAVDWIAEHDQSHADVLALAMRLQLLATQPS